MLVDFIIALAIILVAAIVFYAMHQSKPSSLKLSASLLKLFSVSIEVESDDRREEPPPSDRPEQRRKGERGRHRG